jgi:hypothetical protein
VPLIAASVSNNRDFSLAILPIDAVLPPLSLSRLLRASVAVARSTGSASVLKIKSLEAAVSIRCAKSAPGSLYRFFSVCSPAWLCHGYASIRVLRSKINVVRLDGDSTVIASIELY